MIQIDVKTLEILKAIEAEKEIHFRGLIRATGMGQNALNPRINNLKQAGRVKERRVGQRRQFFLTAKGYQAVKDHYASRGADLIAFLQMTKEGKELLERISENQKRQEAEITMLKAQLTEKISEKLGERIKKLEADFEELKRKFQP